VLHVVEILDPLEVGGTVTTGVDEQVGEHVDSHLLQSLTGVGSNGSVGTLGDHLTLEVLNVALVDDVLAVGRDVDIAFLIDGGVVLPGLLGVGVVPDTTLSLEVGQ